MITYQRVIVFAWMLSLLLLCGETLPSFAEQMKTDESRADFLKALRPRPQLPARPKGLQTKGMPVSKGPAQVVADYETLITQPLARSLILFHAWRPHLQGLKCYIAYADFLYHGKMTRSGIIQMHWLMLTTISPMNSFFQK